MYYYAQLQDKCKPAILNYEQIKLKEEEERETKMILITIVQALGDQKGRNVTVSSGWWMRFRK